MSGTDFTQTPNYGLYKPLPNADINQWGSHLNSNADTLDALLGPAGAFNLITASGTPAARSLQSRFAEVINVRDWGAKGDGTTDDTSAINAALNYARSISTFSVGRAIWRLTFPAGRYIVTGPLNFTQLAGLSGGVIDGCGSELWLKSATAVVDCLTSRWLEFRDLSIYGDPTTSPAIGMQIGRISAQSADFINLVNVKFWGSFTFTCFYNFASETFTAYSCTFNNAANVSTSWCIVQDGINHFNAQSTFVTVTAPVGTPQSNNSSQFYCCTTQVAGTGGNVWLSNVSAHCFQHCYASNFTGSPFVIYAYSSSNPVAAWLEIDCHCETSGLQHIVLFTGPAGITYVSAVGFSVSDYNCYASVSVLGIDAGSALTQVELRDAKFRISGPCPKLFDTPSKWAVQANEAAILTGMWATPLAWSGPVLTLGDVRQSFEVARGWLSTARPGAMVGAFGYATDTGTFEFLDGTGWHSFLSSLGGTISGGLTVNNTATFNQGLVFQGGVNVAGSIYTDSNWGCLLRGRTGTSADIGLQANDGTIKLEIGPVGIGFNGTAAIAKPTISGAKGGNTALASVVALLAAYGLGTDSTTA